MFSIDVFTVGVPGLDAKLLSWVDLEHGQGVVLAPSDPWFIFSPALLPAISTEWVRQYNLDPKTQKWLYWMPFDAPYDVFEWSPKWDPAIKRFKPLSQGGFPCKVPLRQHSALFHRAKHAFLEYWREDAPEDAWPPVLTARTGLVKV